MQYAFRASIATLGIKARYKLGFDAARSQDFQTWFTNVKVPSPDKMHVLDGLLAFVEHLGIRDIEPKWSLTCQPDDLTWAEAQFQPEQPRLVVVPGASKAYKNWTAEGYAAVIEHAQQQGWQVILAGSPAQVERDLAAQVEQALAHPVLNLVGKSTLQQMLALLAKADLVIAPIQALRIWLMPCIHQSLVSTLTIILSAQVHTIIATMLFPLTKKLYLRKPVKRRSRLIGALGLKTPMRCSASPRNK